MSQRPVFEKKLRRLRKELARRPLPAFIDLIDWLQTRGHAQTAGQARKIILARRVKSESHVLGIGKAPVARHIDGKVVVEMVEVVDPYVPVAVRPTLRVEAAKE